jgi:hypothetical protein
MPRTGTSKVIGFLMAAQRPLDEHYLNEGEAWESVEAALAGIPLISRSAYKLINIAGVLYWFKSNLTELEPVSFATIADAGDVSLADAGELFVSENVEDALAEVMTDLNALSVLFDTFKENNFVVNNYTVYNSGIYYAEFLCVNVEAPIIPLDIFGNAALINADITLMVRDTQPIKADDYGFEKTTGLITLSVPLQLGERLYINYKKSSIA